MSMMLTHATLYGLYDGKPLGMPLTKSYRQALILIEGKFNSMCLVMPYGMGDLGQHWFR